MKKSSKKKWFYIYLFVFAIGVGIAAMVFYQSLYEKLKVLE